MELSRSDGLTGLVGQISRVIEQARGHIRQSVNHAMVASYWEIGRLIVEHEQQGQTRAAYGRQQLAEISTRLTGMFGKGFDVSNLRTMRRFYQAFPIRDAVRLELGWTHYRALLRVENPAARAWYMTEAIGQNWSSRALERQIGVLYYERLLSRKDKALVQAEASQHTAPLAETGKDWCCAAKKAKRWCAIQCWPSSSSCSRPNTCLICPARKNSSANCNVSASWPCNDWRGSRRRSHDAGVCRAGVKAVLARISDV
jgi:hypothetical protein